MSTITLAYGAVRRLEERRAAQLQGAPSAIWLRKWLSAAWSDLIGSESQSLITTLLLLSRQCNACKDGLFEAAGRANLKPSTQEGATDG